MTDDKLYPGPPERGTHVFEGEPDERQSLDPGLKTSRFRPQYRALSPNQKELHDRIKSVAGALELLFDEVDELREAEGLPREPRYAALAMTHLEVAVMWSVKGLTS